MVDHPKVDFQRLAGVCEGLTGAEIEVRMSHCGRDAVYQQGELVVCNMDNDDIWLYPPEFNRCLR